MIKIRTRAIGSSALRASSLLALFALFLALATPSMAADPTDRPNCGSSLVSPGAGLFEPAWTAVRDGSIDGPEAQADCTATCWDGTSITCSGSSCTADDSDCANNQRGECWGSDTGTKSCAPCPVCEDPTPCAEKDNWPCSGFGSSDCTFPDGTCGRCDCAGHKWLCTT